MLALLYDNCLLLVEVFLCSSRIDFSAVHIPTDVNYADGLASSEHRCQGLTPLARSSHHVLLPLTSLIHFGFTLDCEYFLLEHFACLFWQLGKVVVLDEAGEALHIQHDLGCRVLHVLVGVRDCRHSRSQDAWHGQDLGFSSLEVPVLRILGHFNTKRVNHLEEKRQLGKQSFVVALRGNIVLSDSIQDSLAGEVLTNLWMVR